uniref:Tryptophan--tRNA ligase, cytoplasmic n=1 Tax=Coccidioides posadasii RMSCC 3488 TaxID=454284 RepID=A0A0J6IFP9_COCPO|nr:tryptophanyl-tRNA synthetase [Coccidioides posadasii RMSCC 3488]
MSPRKASGRGQKTPHASRKSFTSSLGAPFRRLSLVFGSLKHTAEFTGMADSKPEIVVPIRDAEKSASTEQEINPWDVHAAHDEQGNILAFDYVAISQKWATKLIDNDLLERFERLTGHKPHRWLRRGLFFSHRDFDKILDKYEAGEPFFMYTGRGPSSDALHLGHTIPFSFTKWLQDVFDVPLVRVTERKGYHSCGFDPKKTFIFSDLDYVKGHMLMNVWEFAKLITFNQVRGAFGFNESTNIGRIMFPSVQCVASFATSYPEIWSDNPPADRTKAIAKIPCLIPMAIDQDPYFRLVRDNAHRMRYPSPKPALIHSKFLTALQGAGGKMSASDPNSAIFMTDTPNQIKNKINKHAFSGGRDTIEEHRRLGGNPDVDVSFQYLSYFEEDDEKLKQIEESYRKGELLTGELKKMAITLLQEYVKDFQERRKQVTDEVLKQYMTPRKLEWKGNPNPKPKPQKTKEKKNAK